MSSYTAVAVLLASLNGLATALNPRTDSPQSLDTASLDTANLRMLPAYNHTVVSCGKADSVVGVNLPQYYANGNYSRNFFGLSTNFTTEELNKSIFCALNYESGSVLSRTCHTRLIPYSQS